MTNKTFRNIHYPIIISRCQRIKIPSSTRDSQAIWKTVIIMIESYEHEMIKPLTSFQSIKGIIMRVTFNNEKTKLNKLPESLPPKGHVSYRFMPG